LLGEQLTAAMGRPSASSSELLAEGKQHAAAATETDAGIAATIGCPAVGTIDSAATANGQAQRTSLLAASAHRLQSMNPKPHLIAGRD
jgi:hypothetical protein